MLPIKIEVTIKWGWQNDSPSHVQKRICKNWVHLGRAQTNLAKLLLAKALLLKHALNVLSFVKDTTGAHKSSKKQKCFRACFGTF